MGQNVGDLGEFGLLARIAARLNETDQPDDGRVVVGPGDDAAVVTVPDGRVVVTTDMLVDGRHFRRDWSSAYDIGRRAAAANLADVVAMGADPVALVVGLALPSDTEVAWVTGLTDGLRDECAELGATVVGGDIVRVDLIVISGTALGDLGGRKPILRSGAHLGDTVAVAGRLGWAAAGLTVLRRGFRSPRVLADAHRRPDPPYAAALAAARGPVTAMADISDGLVADAGHLAAASGVSIELVKSQLPVAKELLEAAAAFNVDPLNWVLTGGDDHGFVATFTKRRKLPAGFIAIGVVVEGAGQVLVDGEPYANQGGHDHFRD
ncbi:MAG: thiamine-phosphate kinase [Actinomycetes bacterium]